MSYDLEWVELPEDAAVARSRWESCTSTGLMCDHTPVCSQAYFALARPYQFRLNAAGMGVCGVCREGIRRTGMTTIPTEHRPFPAWPFEDMAAWPAADQARRDAYEAAERAVSAQTVPGKSGFRSSNC